MELMQALVRRRSTRDYKPGLITREELDKLLGAGCTSPVGRAMYENLHFTVVQDKAVLAAIAQAGVQAGGKDPTYGAPTLIFVSARDTRGLDYANAACVVQTMHLAATDLNLGSVYLFGFLQMMRDTPELLDKLRLPEGFIPLSALGVGYAAEIDNTERPIEMKISCNTVE